MTTLHQQLTDAYLAHCADNPDAAYARKAFDAGAKAALEIAAEEVEREGWIRSDPGEGVDPRVDIAELLRSRAKEIG